MPGFAVFGFVFVDFGSAVFGFVVPGFAAFGFDLVVFDRGFAAVDDVVFRVRVVVDLGFGLAATV